MDTGARPNPTTRLLLALALIAFATSLQLVLSDVDEIWTPGMIWGAAIACLGCAVLLLRTTLLAWAAAVGGGVLAVAVAYWTHGGAVKSGPDFVAFRWQDGSFSWSSELAVLLATGLVLVAAVRAWRRRDTRRALS